MRRSTPVLLSGISLLLLLLAAGPAHSAVAVDATVSTDRTTASTTVASPAFSTLAGNELLLAFIATDARSGTNITVQSVSGAGLTWVLVVRTNGQQGTSEIWRALAPSPLSSAVVTATLTQSVLSSITVISFTGADTSGVNGSGAIGSTTSKNAPSGAPTATLISTRNNSLVFAVGNDYDKAIARVPGSGQTLVHQFLAPVGDTYWVQRQTNPIPVSLTTVTINDASPSTDRYNLSLVEILPALSTVPDLTVTKSHSGNFIFGQTGAGYTLTVTNAGGAPTTGTATLSDTLPTGLTATAISGTGWTCVLSTLTCTRADALNAGTSYPPVSLVVNVANNAPSSVTNTATVSGGGETNTANDTASDPTAITAPLVPDLTVAKSHSGNFTQGQSAATYTISVKNVGTAATSGTVSMIDTLPTGLTASAISGTGWSCAVATISCTRADALAANASFPNITLTVSVAANAPASVINTANVSGGGETNTANDTASDPTTITAPLVPDLTVAKSHSGNFTQGQSAAIYTISVKNVGTAATSGAVSMIDTLPTGLTASAISGTGWTCTLATITCTRTNSLAANASFPNITLTVSVAGNASTSVTNSVAVSGGGETNSANNAATDVTTINPAPDLTVTKAHAANFVQGQVGALYTITVTNSGGSPTSSTVSMIDTLPTGLTASAISGSGWTCALATLTCTRTDALPAATSYSPISLSVNVANNASASLTNTVTVSGGGEVNTANDTATDVTTVVPQGVLVHVGGAAVHPPVTNQTFSFNYSPVQVSDAVVILVGCRAPGVSSMVLTSPGWNFTPVSGLVGPSGELDYIRSYGAIVPTTASSTFTVTLAGGNGDCSGNDTTILVDEFSGADTTGGTTTFEAHNESLDSPGFPNCTGAPLTPANNNDAIWYACFDNVTGVSGGYTKGQDDATGDWSEYQILTGGAGIIQNAGFLIDPKFISFGLVGVAIKPAGAIPDLTIAKTHSGNFLSGQSGALYSINVSNSGSAATFGTVVVSDLLPVGLTATAISGSGWTCTLASMSCTRNDSLAAAASYPAITLTVNVAGNLSGSVTNQATVSGGGEVNTANDTASDPTIINTIPLTGIKLIQSNFNGNESGTSNMSAAFPANNTLGNFLIVTGSAARPATTLSISDTLGNSYTPAIGPVIDPTQNVTIYIWYVPVCKGGANTVTITPSTTAALEIHLSEWTGLATTSPVDQITSATGTGTNVSSGPQTTSINGELIFGYGWVFNTASAGTGFTPISLINGDLDEYLIQNSAGSVAATFTQTSGTWFALMATFKPAGWSISGTVSGGAGASLTLSGPSNATTLADASGNFTFNSLPNGVYTVTPGEPGFTMSPANQSVTISAANVVGINFVATQIPPVLSVLPPGVLISATQGGSNPAPASISVTNSSGGPLSFTTASDSSWLTANPPSGTAPVQLQLSATIGGLAVGTYKGHVTITAAGAQGSPVTVTVTLIIGVANDWLTVDHDPSRSGNAFDETAISPTNVANLQFSWSTPVDGSITAQPLIVHAIQIAGQSRDVLLVGTANNTLYGLDANNGSTIWSRNFGPPTPNTWGLPDGFGIEAPPYIDRVTERIYTVSTDGSFHTISLVDGTDLFTPFALIANPVTNKVWGGLNKVDNLVYVASASNGGDVAPWRGQVYSIDVSATPTLAGNFVVVPSIPAPNGGGGIWGYGGVSADLVSGTVYGSSAFDSNVSGNGNENTAIYSNSVFALDPNLNLLGYYQPPPPTTIPCTGAPCDLDFASTPAVFQPAGCPSMVAAGSKNGNLYLFRAADLQVSGQPWQVLALNAPNDSLGSGGVGGVPAWSPANNMLYITDAGSGVTGVAGGVVALKVTSSCTLQIAWSNQLGGSDTPNSTPTIANGVVFVGQGNSGVIHAYNAQTGVELWHSGTQYAAAATFAAPIVAAGKLFVGSWASFSGGGIVGAFTLNTVPVLSVSPQSLSFSAPAGGPDPAPKSIAISNAGLGALNFTAASDSPSWLTVSPASGAAPQTLQVAATVAGLAAGTYTGHITITAVGAQNSPTSVTVTLTVGTGSPPPVIDVSTSKDNSAAANSISSPAFSTKAANELLLAFVSTDFTSGASTTVTGVSGGGLTWALVNRTNTQRGTSEIWRAFASATLANVSVVATLSQSVASSLTVMSFSGVDTSGTNGSGAIGSIGSNSASTGAPTASLVTTRNNSLVLGVGNDYDKAIGRTPGAGQVLIHQYLATVGDTYWVQMQTNPIPLASTTVTINDTAPATDRYNLSICSVVPAP